MQSFASWRARGDVFIHWSGERRLTASRGSAGSGLKSPVAVIGANAWRLRAGIAAAVRVALVCPCQPKGAHGIEHRVTALTVARHDLANLQRCMVRVHEQGGHAHIRHVPLRHPLSMLSGASVNEPSPCPRPRRADKLQHTLAIDASSEIDRFHSGDHPVHELFKVQNG